MRFRNTCSTRRLSSSLRLASRRQDMRCSKPLAARPGRRAALRLVETEFGRDLRYRDYIEEIYSMEILRKSLKSLRILLVPSTTQHNGSSAMHTGSPVSSRIRLSKLFSKAPPPASTMPRSMMSAESSGGVRSSATLIALTMVLDAFAQRLADFAVVHGDRLWHTLDEVPAFDLHG